MADYNVNMKQWNGSSFDNVLPLAFNSNQLGGQSLDQIKQWVNDNNLLLYTGQYTGTGTYGVNNPTSITFPFKPIILFLPIAMDSGNYYFTSANTPNQPNWYGYVQFASMIPDSSYTSPPVENYNFIRKINNGMTIQFYSNYAGIQANTQGFMYYYAAIGGNDIGGQTEWTITSSGTWTVPRTGRYMLELYGGGGGAINPLDNSGPHQGGSSCQSYSSINLTTGTVIQVSVGVGGESATEETGTTLRTATGTTFGTYSVDGGGQGNSSTNGSGSGNKGTNGTNSATKNNSSGTQGKKYGYGGYFTRVPNVAKSDGGPGAVYLKYLGA